MEESKVIFGYTRVSTEEQAQHGISVDAQRDILNGYAAMRQLPITIYSDPGFSGKDTNRPALQRLLKDCRRGGVDTVIVWKLDRLSRSLRTFPAIACIWAVMFRLAIRLRKISIMPWIRSGRPLPAKSLKCI